MKNIVWLFLAVLIISCASHKQNEEQNIESLQAIIEQGDFEIESRWAEPRLTNSMLQLGNAGLLPFGSTPGQIDIIGTPNFIRVKNDIVEAELPFFGERQFGGHFKSMKSGIVFEGKPTDMKITKNKKSGYDIHFKIKDKNVRTESYSVTINLKPNLTSVVNINSSHRFNIQYRGKVKKLQTDG